MNIFVWILPLFLYLICYCTPLRYKTPFKWIERHWEVCHKKDRVRLTFNLKRERYFGLGLTYEWDLDFRYIEEINDTKVLERHTYTLHLLYIYFVLVLFKPYEK